MKKYFNMEYASFKPEIIGVEEGFQATIMKDTMTTEEIAQYTNLVLDPNPPGRIGQFIETEIKIPNLKLLKKATITDVIDYVDAMPYGNFIISEKLQLILQQFGVNNYQLHDVNFFDSNLSLLKGYKLWYLPSQEIQLIQNIEWLQCLFYEGQGIGTNLESKTVFPMNLNYEKYKLWIDKNIFTRGCQKLVFNNQFTFPHLFRLLLLSYNSIFVSEELKSALEMANITGIYFKEPKNPYLEFLQ